MKIFLILIAIMASSAAWGWDCPDQEKIVVLAPRSGVRTQRDSISIRGYLCQNYRVVLVKNTTTKKIAMTGTDELCHGKEGCIYTFAVYVDDLAMGTNELTATIPGLHPPIEVHLSVIRTAFAMK